MLGAVCSVGCESPLLALTHTFGAGASGSDRPSRALKLRGCIPDFAFLGATLRHWTTCVRIALYVAQTIASHPHLGPALSPRANCPVCPAAALLITIECCASPLDPHSGFTDPRSVVSAVSTMALFARLLQWHRNLYIFSFRILALHFHTTPSISPIVRDRQVVRMVAFSAPPTCPQSCHHSPLDRSQCSLPWMN